MKIFAFLSFLFCLSLAGVAFGDVGFITGGSTVGDTGTASVAPTWNPDVSHGILDMSSPGAETYIPSGSSLLTPSPQAREGIDSLGGFDGTEVAPGVVGRESNFLGPGPSDLTFPGSVPANGGGLAPGGHP